MPNVSKRIVEQRVRNRVMEYLELAGSFDDQERYDEHPIVNVSNEVISQWEDWVRTDPNGQPDFLAVYSPQEVAAMRQFHLVWQKAADALPNDYPELSEAQALPEWSALRDEAQAALAVFEVRGSMPEYREAY